jgi:hypothetical protein
MEYKIHLTLDPHTNHYKVTVPLGPASKYPTGRHALGMARRRLDEHIARVDSHGLPVDERLEHFQHGERLVASLLTYDGHVVTFMRDGGGSYLRVELPNGAELDFRCYNPGCPDDGEPMSVEYIADPMIGEPATIRLTDTYPLDTETGLPASPIAIAHAIDRVIQHLNRNIK